MFGFMVLNPGFTDGKQKFKQSLIFFFFFSSLCGVAQPKHTHTLPRVAWILSFNGVQASVGEKFTFSQITD